MPSRVQPNVAPSKPIVLLDVDGVINWFDSMPPLLLALHGLDPMPPPDDLVDHSPVNGYTMRISEESAAVVRALVEVAEVWWCSTWRHDANRFVAPLLGIRDDLPVIDDHTYRRDAEWKIRQVEKHLGRWRTEGRQVFWIEDFSAAYSRPFQLDGVTQIDTTPWGRLRWDDLPAALLELMSACPPDVLAVRRDLEAERDRADREQAAYLQQMRVLYGEDPRDWPLVDIDVDF